MLLQASLHEPCSIKWFLDWPGHLTYIAVALHLALRNALLVLCRYFASLLYSKDFIGNCPLFLRVRLRESERANSLHTMLSQFCISIAGHEGLVSEQPQQKQRIPQIQIGTKRFCERNFVLGKDRRANPKLTWIAIGVRCLHWEVFLVF